MKRSDLQTKPMAIRMPVELKAKLEAQATLDRRSTTDLVISIVTRWFDKELYTPLERLPAAPKAAPVKAKPEKPAPPAFKRPPGRMRSANWGLHDPAYVTAIKKHLPDDGERTLADIFKLFDCDPLTKPMFAQALEANLLIVGWRPMIRTSDGRDVWLGPSHPHNPARAQ